MATSLLPYNLIKAHKIDIKAVIRSSTGVRDEVYGQTML
jgi:hypothetical protein